MSDLDNKSTPTNLAPSVHSNAQLRAIHARLKKKQEGMAGSKPSLYIEEMKNPVGASTKPS